MQGAQQALRAARRQRHAKKAYAQIEHELTVIEELNFPGYFLVVWEIVQFARAQRDPVPGQGIGGLLGGLLRAGDHRGRRGRLRPAVRAVPRAGARRATGHRRRHRVRPARGGHPVRLRDLRPRPRRAGRQRHHLPAAVGDPRRRQGARLLHGQQDAWSKQIEHGYRHDGDVDGVPEQVARARRRAAQRARGTSGSTPAGW